MAELAEGARLLSEYRGNPSIVGSNPTLSAKKVVSKEMTFFCFSAPIKNKIDILKFALYFPTRIFDIKRVLLQIVF